ncbi:hypothetical protein F3J23_06110 [Chryseobacterium sp. Tr-659]|uniref:hypothetical protein n=1 Tax=Chryseobacterium sp. Tr-659 TaxID=2608340 RepID=UPI00141EC607|nr:hypothetical protein [Chryseobacterium sp. Tr-659]NIF05012.1 hypothetical protein [Chryseobacterium sp. Tr-659]
MIVNSAKLSRYLILSKGWIISILRSETPPFLFISYLGGLSGGKFYIINLKVRLEDGIVLFYNQKIGV